MRSSLGHSMCHPSGRIPHESALVIRTRHVTAAPINQRERLAIGSVAAWALVEIEADDEVSRLRVKLAFCCPLAHLRLFLPHNPHVLPSGQPLPPQIEQSLNL